MEELKKQIKKAQTQSDIPLSRNPHALSYAFPKSYFMEIHMFIIDSRDDYKLQVRAGRLKSEPSSAENHGMFIIKTCNEIKITKKQYEKLYSCLSKYGPNLSAHRSIFRADGMYTLENLELLFNDGILFEDETKISREFKALLETLKQIKQCNHNDYKNNDSELQWNLRFQEAPLLITAEQELKGLRQNRKELERLEDTQTENDQSSAESTVADNTDNSFKPIKAKKPNLQAYFKSSTSDKKSETLNSQAVKSSNQQRSTLHVLSEKLKAVFADNIKIEVSKDSTGECIQIKQATSVDCEAFQAVLKKKGIQMILTSKEFMSVVNPVVAVKKTAKVRLFKNEHDDHTSLEYGFLLNNQNFHKFCKLITSEDSLNEFIKSLGKARYEMKLEHYKNTHLIGTKKCQLQIGDFEKEMEHIEDAKGLISLEVSFEKLTKKIIRAQDKYNQQREETQARETENMQPVCS